MVRTRRDLNQLSTSGGIGCNATHIGGSEHKEHVMSLGTILLVVIILMLIGVLPTWPHARTWGYGPSGAVGVILIILVILLVMGRI